jgi:hypothetical protein
MFPHRPRHAIGGPSCGPAFGLFPRHRGCSQRENGSVPYICERFLVSGFGTPDLHLVARTHDVPSYALTLGSARR